MPSALGGTHDYQLFKDTGGEAHFPPKVVLYGDKGFQGVEGDYTGRVIHIPKVSVHPLCMPPRAERRVSEILRSLRSLRMTPW